MPQEGQVHSALNEPYFGFSQQLDSGSLTGMVKGICEADIQTSLLVSSLENLSARVPEHLFNLLSMRNIGSKTVGWR
jgi:hypothetical protein